MCSKQHRPVARSGNAGSPGFSLIEVIGGLAIVAILAMALVPVLIREYDRLARDHEARQQTRIMTGLRSSILRNRTIPAGADMADAIATELGLQTSEVLLNSRRLPRVFLLDPAITNTFPIPFAQGQFGTTSTIPLSVGIAIISSVSQPLPTGLVSGFAATSVAFSNIWATAENSIPTDWTWSGRGDDLRIARLNLGTLFVPLSLNYETFATAVTNQGRFTIDGSGTNALPSAPSFLSNYLIGTVLGLHSHTGTSGTLQAQLILENPSSFFYQGSVWRGQSFLGRGMRPTGPLDVQAAHDLFIASPANDNAQGSPQATPTLVINAMTTFLQEYIAWRNAGYPSSHHDLDDAQTELDGVTSDLLHRASK